MVSFLVSLLALSPVATLVSGAETNEVWSVQRLKQDCGKGGCSQEFYISGTFKAWPQTQAFDSRCTGLAFGGEWKECQSYLPYGGYGGFAKISARHQESNTHKVWFTILDLDGGKTVNKTGLMEVEATTSFWDVGKCRQMTVVSKEDV